MNDNLGLRARKRARTREMIARAAMTSFLRKGYEATTLDEIAEAADVHKRTLLRYFPSKVHLVLQGQYAALARFQEAVARRDGRRVIDVWEDHVVTYSREYRRQGRQSNMTKITSIEPAVSAAYLAVQARYQEIIAQELCLDLGRDPAIDIVSKVAAAALVGGNYAVGTMLLEREAYEEIEVAERQVIRLVRDLLPAQAVTPDR